MNQAGFVVVAMAGLWIAYLVPHRLRYRQQLLESRTEDRFSERLRVLRVAQVTAGRSGSGAAVTRGSTQRPEVRSAGVRLHASRAAVTAGGERVRRAGGGGSMDRPHESRDRLVADAARHSAAEHAQRAAHLARRKAAARRRALIVLALVVTVAAGWSVVGLAGAAILLGAVPTVALGAVLALGRRAVIAGVRADTQWEAGAATRAPLPASNRKSGVIGRAVRPSEATTEVMARVPATGAARSPAAAGAVGAGASARSTSAASTGDQAASDDTSRSTVPRVTTRGITAEAEARAESGTWEPVPVPRPAYTLKPAARRAEPAPLDLDELGTSTRQRAGDEIAPAGTTSERPADDVPSGADAVPAQAVSPEQPAAGARLDLDAILARRRASGE